MNEILVTGALVFLILLMMHQAKAQDSVAKLCPLSVEFQGIITEKGLYHDIPYRLIWAVITVESAGYVGAVSPKGCKGLMQISEICLRHYCQEHLDCAWVSLDLYHPRVNIEIGCWYLRWLQDRLHDWRKVLRAYNGGLGGMELAECYRYSTKVWKLYES